MDGRDHNVVKQNGQLCFRPVPTDVADVGWSDPPRGGPRGYFCFPTLSSDVSVDIYSKVNYSTFRMVKSAMCWPTWAALFPGALARCLWCWVSLCRWWWWERGWPSSSAPDGAGSSSRYCRYHIS